MNKKIKILMILQFVMVVNMAQANLYKKFLKIASPAIFILGLSITKIGSDKIRQNKLKKAEDEFFSKPVPKKVTKSNYDIEVSNAAK